jgi:hypothetical protein
MFDVTLGAWQTETSPLSYPRGHMAAASTVRYSYFAGGLANSQGGPPVGNVDVYDGYQDNWYTAPSLANARKCAVAVAFGNSVFVFGGDNRRDMYKYVGIAQQSLADAPVDFVDACGAALGQFLIVAGDTTNTAYSFDTVSSTWTNVAAFSGTVGGSSSCAVVNDDFFSVGGWNGSTSAASNQVHAFYPSSPAELTTGMSTGTTAVSTAYTSATTGASTGTTGVFTTGDPTSGLLPSSTGVVSLSSTGTPATTGVVSASTGVVVATSTAGGQKSQSDGSSGAASETPVFIYAIAGGAALLVCIVLVAVFVVLRRRSAASAKAATGESSQGGYVDMPVLHATYGNTSQVSDPASAMEYQNLLRGLELGTEIGQGAFGSVSFAHFSDRDGWLVADTAAFFLLFYPGRCILGSTSPNRWLLSKFETNPRQPPMTF